MNKPQRHLIQAAIALSALVFLQAPLSAQTVQVKPHEVWGAGGLFATAGFNLIQGLDQSPGGIGMVYGGYGYSYVTPNIKLGGMGMGTGVEETIDGDLFSGGFGGGGPFIGHESRFADIWSISFDFGVLFGFTGMDQKINSATPGTSVPDAEVHRGVGSFAMGYAAAATLDAKVARWLRIGLRLQTLVATDYGINGVNLIAPGAGLVFTFGAHPGFFKDRIVEGGNGGGETIDKPTKPTWPISMDDSPRMGDSEDVVILVYSDFQCPYCGRADVAIRQVMEKLGNKASLIFKHYPLPYHTRAQEAAEASMAAFMQGKFWEYSELLFANPKSLEDEDLLAYAKQVGLDLEQFKADLKGGQPYRWILRDMAQAKKVNLRGTPTIMINGADYTGNRDPDFMARFIKEKYLGE